MTEGQATDVTEWYLVKDSQRLVKDLAKAEKEDSDEH